MSSAEDYEKQAAHCKEKYHLHSLPALLPTMFGMLEMLVVLCSVMLVLFACSSKASPHANNPEYMQWKNSRISDVWICT